MNRLTYLFFVAIFFSTAIASAQETGISHKELESQKRYKEIASTDYCFEVGDTNALACFDKKRSKHLVIIKDDIADVNPVSQISSSKRGEEIEYLGDATIKLIRKKNSGTMTCDGTAYDLKKVSKKVAKDAMKKASFRVPKNYRAVYVKKTDDGTLVVAIREPWSEPRVYVGSSTALKQLAVKKVKFYKDGGTTFFKLENGGEVYFPKRMFNKSSSFPKEAYYQATKEGEKKTLGPADAVEVSNALAQVPGLEDGPVNVKPCKALNVSGVQVKELDK